MGVIVEEVRGGERGWRAARRPGNLRLAPRPMQHPRTPARTTPLPRPRSHHAALVHDGRLYVVGGRGYS